MPSSHPLSDRHDANEQLLAEQFERTAHQPSTTELAQMARFAAQVPTTAKPTYTPFRAWLLLGVSALASGLLVYQLLPEAVAYPPMLASSSTPISNHSLKVEAPSTEPNEANTNDDINDTWFEDNDTLGLNLLHPADNNEDMDAVFAGYAVFE